MASFYSSQHERGNVECTIEFFMNLSSEEVFEGVIDNISESGFCLITSKHLEEDQKITLKPSSIFLPSHSATVCWVQPLEDGNYKFGLKFR